MSKVPPLAFTVNVRGRNYAGGSVPPVEIAKQIKSKAAWGGKVPDLSGARDSKETGEGTLVTSPGAPGVLGGDAAIPAAGDPDFEGETRTPATPEDGGSWQFPETEEAEPVNAPIEPTVVDAPVEDQAPKAETKPRKRTSSTPKP